MCKWTYELVKYSMIGIERNSSSTPYILEVFPLYLAIGPARHGTARARVRHGPEDVGPIRHAGLPGRAQLGVVPDQGPRHGLLGRFSGRAGPRSTAKTAGCADPRPTECQRPIEGKQTLEAAAGALESGCVGCGRTMGRVAGRRRARGRCWGREGGDR